jgi:hypothetical protein
MLTFHFESATVPFDLGKGWQTVRHRTARAWHRCFLVLLAFGLSASWTALAAPFQIISARDSAQSAPAGGSSDSWLPLITPDGRYVLFASTANNLVLISNAPLPTVIPAAMNVYLRDRSNAITSLVSVNLAGTGGGNGNSLPTGISTNGRYALFESSASDLVAGDTNNISDVFIRDMVAGVTVLVSAATNGGWANGASQNSVLTPDGGKVVFVSAASNLVPGDTNGIPDVFVRDWQAGVTTLASVGAIATNFSVLQGGSDSPSITPDGRYVAFYSAATNLVPGLTNLGGDVYVRDLVGATSWWASVAARATVKAAMNSNNASSFNPLISDDGQYVAYETAPNNSAAGLVLRYSLPTGLTDLVATNATTPFPSEDWDQNWFLDMTPDGQFIAFVANTNDSSGVTTCVWLWDAATGLATLASGGLDGTVTSNSTCAWPAVDASGRFVAFLSGATNLVTNGLSGPYHLYLRDTQLATTTLLDADTNGVGSLISPTTRPQLSSNATFVAFECPDSSLVPHDCNRADDVFVRNLAAATTELISVHDAALPSASANGVSSLSPLSVSSNGQYIAFSSDADSLNTNMTDNTNAFANVFVSNLALGANILVSVATDGITAGNGTSVEPAISGAGRYVAFTSGADNLVPGVTNLLQNVYVRDLQGGTTVLVSVNSSGTGPGNAASYSPLIGTDGAGVLFRSKASNLAAGSFSSGSENLFFRSLSTATAYALTTGGVLSSSMTPDGSMVAFSGEIPGTSVNKIYVWNSQTGARIYTNSASGASCVAISPNGQWITYATNGSLYGVNLASGAGWLIGPSTTSSHPGLQFSRDSRFLAYAGTLNKTNQVFLYDSLTGSNTLVSQSYSGSNGAAGPSDWPAISPDGRFVVYRSSATNLTANSTAAYPNLFLYDRFSGANALLTSSRYANAAADNRSLMPVFSGDGQTLLIQSWAADLAAQDCNQTSDVFAYPMPTVTLLPAAVQGQGPTLTWPVIPNLNYQMQFKNNLGDPLWQKAGTVTIIGNQGLFVDPLPNPGQRFYRLVIF